MRGKWDHGSTVLGPATGQKVYSLNMAHIMPNNVSVISNIIMSNNILILPLIIMLKEWQPTPVFLPGESQGWGSLVGCCLWGRTESDMTEAT